MKLRWDKTKFEGYLVKLRSRKAGLIGKKATLVITKPEERFEIRKITQCWDISKDTVKKIPTLSLKHYLSETRMSVGSHLMGTAYGLVEYFNLYGNNSLWGKRLSQHLTEFGEIIIGAAKAIPRHERKLAKKAKKAAPPTRIEFLKLRKLGEQLLTQIARMKSDIQGPIRAQMLGLDHFIKTGGIVLPQIVKRKFLIRNSWVNMFNVRIKISASISNERHLESYIKKTKDAIKKGKLKVAVRLTEGLVKAAKNEWDKLGFIYDTSWKIILDILQKSKSVEDVLKKRRETFDIPENLLKFDLNNKKRLNEAFASAINETVKVNNQMWGYVKKAEEEVKKSLVKLKKVA